MAFLQALAITFNDSKKSNAANGMTCTHYPREFLEDFFILFVILGLVINIQREQAGIFFRAGISLSGFCTINASGKTENVFSPVFLVSSLSFKSAQLPGFHHLGFVVTILYTFHLLQERSFYRMLTF